MDDAARRLPLRQDMDKTTGANVFPDHDSRKLHHADAGQRRLAQYRHVVGDEAGTVRDQGRPAISMIELPLMIAMRRAGIAMACATSWQVICAHAASAPSSKSPEQAPAPAPPTPLWASAA